MRLIFSIFILASFTVKPLLEVSTVLYYELNIDYIIDTYCVNKERPWLNCNGKCYLMSQMNSHQEPIKDNPKNTVSTESFIPLFFQSIEIKLQNTISNTKSTIQIWKQEKWLKDSFLYNIDHPPEV